MVIYLKPATRIRVAVVLSVVLVVLGVRAGLSLQGEPVEVTAKITPISHVETSLLEVGVIVDVTTGGPEEAIACLATLEAMGAKTTWFVTATFAEAQEGLVKEIVAKGHELGIKGTDDKRIDNLPQAEMKDRLQRSRLAFSKIGLEAAPFLYPPGERYSDALVSLAFQEGFQAVKPAVNLTKMKGKEADAAKKVADDLRAGDILLVRVDKKGTLPAERYLAALTAQLATQNMTIVPLSQLFRGVQ